MRKIKNMEINKKSQRILKELNEIRENVITDVIVCNMNLIAMKKYVDKSLTSYEEVFHEIVVIFFEESPLVNKILFDLEKINNVRMRKFKGISLEDLKKEFNKGIIPATYEQVGITPSMVIFYYICKNIIKDEKFNYAVEEELKKIKKDKEYYEFLKDSKEVIELEGKLKNSIEEQAMNMFYNGLIKHSGGEILEEGYKRICEKYYAKMLDNKMLINPNLMIFFDNEFEYIVDLKYSLEKFMGYNTTILNNSLSLMKHNIEKFQKNKEIYSELDKLKNENENLKREINFLNKTKVEDFTENNFSKLLELKKENYYLKTKIEKLEKEKIEKIEEIANLKEIKEDIKIEKEIINGKIEIYKDESIVIIGGKWDSRKKTEVHKKYNADFILPEDVFKNYLRIKGYDIVIFDTSRNSHKNYYKVKALAENLYLINKSDIESLNKIFTF